MPAYRSHLLLWVTGPPERLAVWVRSRGGFPLFLKIFYRAFPSYMALQSEIGKHLDLSDRRVRGLIKCGVLPASMGRGGMDVDVCRLSYIRYLRGLQAKQAADPGSADIDLDRERALNLRADTRLKKLKLNQLQKELAPVDLLQWILHKTCAQISETLGEIPERVKMRVPRLSNAELEIVGREIIRCQKVATEAKLDIDEFDRDGGLQDRSIPPL